MDTTMAAHFIIPNDYTCEPLRYLLHVCMRALDKKGMTSDSPDNLDLTLLTFNLPSDQ